MQPYALSSWAEHRIQYPLEFDAAQNQTLPAWQGEDLQRPSWSMDSEVSRQNRGRCVRQNVAIENPKLRVRRCPFTVSEQRSSTAEEHFFLGDLNLETMTILLDILFHGGRMGMRVDQDLVDPVSAAEIEPNPKQGNAPDG